MAIALYEFVVSAVKKANPYRDGASGRFATGGAGAGAPMRTDGAAALHRVLQPKLDAITGRIDALPKEPKITSDIAQAKVSIDSASKAPTASGSAQSLLNAHQALDNAANKVVGGNGLVGLMYDIKDIRRDVKFLAEALQRP
jgi:hypothetical protein